MKLRKPIRRVSLKRQRELREYRELVRDWRLCMQEEGKWFCHRCGRVPSPWPHHWAGRRGKQLLVVKDFRASCDECNLWAKNHPKEAREEKWIAPVGVYQT